MRKVRKTAHKLDAIVRAEAVRVIGPWPVGLRMLIYPLGDNWRATSTGAPRRHGVDSGRHIPYGLGLELTALSVRLADIENSFAALAETGLDGLIVTDDSSLIPLIPRLIALTAERHLPAIYPFIELLRRMSSEVARNRHADCNARCPLSGGKAENISSR
jgi:hypothetical protein